jgi:hypothetical protein
MWIPQSTYKNLKALADPKTIAGGLFDPITKTFRIATVGLSIRTQIYNIIGGAVAAEMQAPGVPALGTPCPTTCDSKCSWAALFTNPGGAAITCQSNPGNKFSLITPPHESGNSSRRRHDVDGSSPQGHNREH